MRAITDRRQAQNRQRPSDACCGFLPIVVNIAQNLRRSPPAQSLETEQHSYEFFVQPAPPEDRPELHGSIEQAKGGFLREAKDAMTP